MASTPMGRTVEWTGEAPNGETVTRSGLLATASTGAGADTADVVVAFKPSDFDGDPTGGPFRYIETVPLAADHGEAGWIEPATPPYDETP